MSISFPKPFLLFIALFCPVLLGGCSSVARGVTEAVLDNQSAKEDTRMCEIEGTSFGGIRQSLDSQSAENPKTTKVLMVHGISSHLPGYSNRFQKKLYENLGLTMTDATIKTIQLDSNRVQWKDGETHTLGTLRITRHTDAENRRQLIFYELTWSPITAQQKQTLEEDSINNDGLLRANLNGSLKEFLNSTVPDLLIYSGNGYGKITASVAQSACWMIADDWDGLPESGAHQCEKWARSSFSSLARDDHFFVTHSLGSRITIDTIQNFASLNGKKHHDPNLHSVGKVVSDKEFTVFMMANQLPLLQMGRDAPTISEAEKTYCAIDGEKSDERAMRKMNIIAFSDPNDILSYPLPIDFAAKKIDSRICPSVTNISLNIANEKNLFDAVSFANPLTAHSGYMEDDRVIDLIANGIRHDNVTSLINKRCKWLEKAETKKTVGTVGTPLSAFRAKSGGYDRD
ncbi:MAG: hypothetical protein PHX43_07590 [Alphaproteobacteria bacterium]|nr:hypothetical protein [Alphaproteobacteria bacterium]